MAPMLKAHKQPIRPEYLLHERHFLFNFALLVAVCYWTASLVGQSQTGNYANTNMVVKAFNTCDNIVYTKVRISVGGCDIRLFCCDYRFLQVFNLKMLKYQNMDFRAIKEEDKSSKYHF